MTTVDIAAEEVGLFLWSVLDNKNMYIQLRSVMFTLIQNKEFIKREKTEIT